MTVRLFLVRHGDAVEERVNPDRPLSEQGIAEVKKVARFLKAAHIELDGCCHSPKTRSRQTAEIIKQILGSSVFLETKEYLSPDAPREQVLHDIAQGRGNMMIVGHLPFLAYLVSQLILSSENKIIVSIPTSTVVILEKDGGGEWYFVGMVGPEFL